MTEEEQELEQKLLTKIQKELDVKKENRKKPCTARGFEFSTVSARLIASTALFIL